ncbi:uncharacterized protein LOC107613846 isoform X2 [Arachis ipaensis]|uniref:uncharacterized protein LOC107613846 isoform X2 n=1 Tax=Arachis ipaensis TaxID=130454 RepID=UPI000A2B543E|nr:uncharacterized protein LOC107613846 isoform X2 [Arachis ipaensis]
MLLRPLRFHTSASLPPTKLKVPSHTRAFFPIVASSRHGTTFCRRCFSIVAAPGLCDDLRSSFSPTTIFSNDISSSDDLLRRHLFQPRSPSVTSPSASSPCRPNYMSSPRKSLTPPFRSGYGSRNIILSYVLLCCEILRWHSPTSGISSIELLCCEILFRQTHEPHSCVPLLNFSNWWCIFSVYFTRSRSWSYVERPGLLLLGALLIAQLTNPFDLFETFLG